MHLLLMQIAVGDAIRMACCQWPLEGAAKELEELPTVPDPASRQSQDRSGKSEDDIVPDHQAQLLGVKLFTSQAISITDEGVRDTSSTSPAVGMDVCFPGQRVN